LAEQRKCRAARNVIGVRGTSYEIHIKGRLSAQLLAAFEGMDATVQSVETVLRSPVLDQAALHGLLDHIQALGLELIEVRRLPESGGSRSSQEVEDTRDE
jgi:hypothetical protein